MNETKLDNPHERPGPGSLWLVVPITLAWILLCILTWYAIGH